MVNKKGFTLIEILVTIGIFAIIVVVGSMSFFNLFKGSAKTKAANLVRRAFCWKAFLISNSSVNLDEARRHRLSLPSMLST